MYSVQVKKKKLNKTVVLSFQRAIAQTEIAKLELIQKEGELKNKKQKTDSEVNVSTVRQKKVIRLYRRRND